MDDRQKQILALEQDATRLVDELGALKEAVSSYRTATVELDKTRTVLTGFLEQTQNLTQQTHKLIGTVSEIGSANIFAQLDAIQTTLSENERREARRNLVAVIGLGLVVIFQVVILVMLKSAR